MLLQDERRRRVLPWRHEGPLTTALGALLNRPVALSDEQKQHPDYWGYHLAQASGFLCIEDLAERLQHIGYEYLPTELPLRGEEQARRLEARDHV